VTGPDAANHERMRRAIDESPHQMQAVYRRHLLDGSDYPAIAAELGLEVREVEALIAQSIVLIDRKLRLLDR
jgi:DNA-directed RNA polymerase specialized sigma24 family protein